MIIAAGPFSTHEDLSLQPLQELLHVCHLARPDVLILLGPFLDVEHPLIAAGDVDEPFETLFASKVSMRNKLCMPDAEKFCSASDA